MKAFGILLIVIGCLVFGGGALMLALMSFNMDYPGSGAARWWMTSHCVIPGFGILIVGAACLSKDKEERIKRDMESKEDRLKGFKRFD